MQAQFWLDKWNNQETGFHLSNPHPLLRKYYSQVFAPESGVFVPLCGKSEDLSFFAEKGGYTLGCELSEKAVNSYFECSALGKKRTAKISDSYLHQQYTLDNLEILVGNFFDLVPEQVRNCNAIYDRAALIALPQAMRFDYVVHLRQLFKSAKLLLITLEYDQSEMSGPPFSLVEDEIDSLFSFASVKKLYAKDILNKEPKFKDRGLSYLNENVYLVDWSF